MPLFCQNHDNELFKSIESGTPYSFDEYRVQLLYTYRACCNEMRRKEIVVEQYNRVLQSRQFQNEHFKMVAKHFITGSQLGINDLNFYKNWLESDLLETSSIKNFTFKTFHFPLIKICASGVFTPLDYSTPDKIGKYYNQAEPYETVFINIIPTNNSLCLIIGYHNDKTNDWIRNFIDSWQNINAKSLSVKLTELLAARMNSWSMSPDLYDKIPEEKRNQFIEYWNDNSLNFAMQQEVAFDLFEDI